MIPKSEMKDQQWYWGNGYKSNVGQWDATNKLFLFGVPSPIKNQPPMYMREFHVQDEHDGCVGKCFTPLLEIAGPKGVWEPKQSIDLEINMATILGEPHQHLPDKVQSLLGDIND